MSKVLIKVKGLTKEFENRRKGFFSKRSSLIAVNNVDLEILEGETLGLVGESGCGKSTLGKTILQLEKPTSGEVVFEGVDLTTLSKAELRSFRQNMQLVFQDPHSALHSKKKVKWLLEEPLIAHDIGGRKTRRELIRDLIEVVGLSKEHLERYPSELSGGQAQRIGILSALMLSPKFIVADEAVSALDMSIQGQILNLLNRIKKRFNLTMLFITHDLSVCYYMSDRIAVMYLGNIVEVGPAEDVYKKHKHPYTKLLFSSLLTVDKEILNVDIVTKDIATLESDYSGCPFYERCNKKRDRCLMMLPRMIKVAPDHFVRCILYEEIG